jgi:hypothetical protein
MKHRILAVSLLAGGLALIPGIAAAKGARSATITGPRLRVPIELNFDTPTPSGRAQGPARPGPNELANAAGLFAMWPSATEQFSTRAPAGRLGPRYVIVYHWLVGPSSTKPIRQDLYPLAAAGPVTYTPPDQRVFDRQNLRGGWYRADQRLTNLLILAGVPLAHATQTPAQTPHPVAVEPNLAG